MKKIKLSVLLTIFSATTFAQVHTDANGNVGVGTTTPQAKLDVNGSAIINGPGNTLTLKKTNNIPALAFQGINQGAIIEGGDDYLTAYLGGSRRFSIFSNGYVGIGTANPSEKLGIYGTINSAPGVLALETSRNDAAFVEVGSIRAKNSDGEVARIGLLRGSGTYTGAMNFMVRPTNDGELQEAMRINENGNIGIGTTTPTARLEVGTSTDYDQLSLVKNTIEGGKGAGIVFKNLVNNGTFPAIAGIQAKLLDGGVGTVRSSLSLYTTYNEAKIEAITIRPQGNVGIGTSSPDERLAVNGKIRAREIKVETANWPDYVFAEDYKVGTLKELESYIKTNKHLPDMPSAKEAEANGVELGEMNKLLLKKVEELTLHLIEKDKELQNSNQRLQNVEAEQKEIKVLLKKLTKK